MNKAPMTEMTLTFSSGVKDKDKDCFHWLKLSETSYNSVVEALPTFILSLFKIWILVGIKLFKNLLLPVLGI